MSDSSNPRDAQMPALRPTGNMPRPQVIETADPAGKRPVAQWVISGSVARPAHEVLADPTAGSSVPARPTQRPAWWLLALSAAVGFAVAVPVTWLLFSLCR